MHGGFSKSRIQATTVLGNSEVGFEKGIRRLLLCVKSRMGGSGKRFMREESLSEIEEAGGNDGQWGSFGVALW